VYALVEPNGTIPNTVELKADSPDGPLSIFLPVERTKGTFIHRLAARSLIRDLEQGTSGRQINAQSESKFADSLSSYRLAIIDTYPILQL